MKRQTQVLGVRNWYGDAFVSLQEEPLKVIDGFFSPVSYTHLTLPTKA